MTVQNRLLHFFLENIGYDIGYPYVPAHNAGPMCCYREAELTLGQKMTDEQRSHPSPKCCQLSRRHCVGFIFCKVRTCRWKEEVGTAHGVITSHPRSEFRHSLLRTGTATAHTCQSSLDLASLTVYKSQERHAGMEYRDVHQPGLTLMCS